MTLEQLKIVRHAYGADTDKPGFRGHYAAKLDDPDAKALQKSGHFYLVPQWRRVHYGYGIFYLTPKGIALAKRKKQKGRR